MGRRIVILLEVDQHQKVSMYLDVEENYNSCRKIGPVSLSSVFDIDPVMHCGFRKILNRVHCAPILSEGTSMVNALFLNSSSSLRSDQPQEAIYNFALLCWFAFGDKRLIYKHRIYIHSNLHIKKGKWGDQMKQNTTNNSCSLIFHKHITGITV